MENKKILARPEILAPAGNLDCFLAALAAGADAVYLGLKHFSARMEAENFGFAPLAAMLELAHAHNRKIYVAMNTLIKPHELSQAWRMLTRLVRQAPCDGLIFQDLSMLEIARQTGFQGKLTFSTLANVSFPKALELAAKMGADRVVIPRELSLDEMKLMGEACPDNLELECFIHGALCYCVSGRCYWSSYMGGKSGLRGRCAQPCRRNYSPLQNSDDLPQNLEKGRRFFSCQDLELGVLVKTLLHVPRLASWKIEGRKKGPHYVYHTVTAYRILRDHPDDPAMKKMALEILEQALGRPGVKARFLSQRPVAPMDPEKSSSSGLLAGKISFNQRGECQLRPRFPLLPADFLRIGVEDEPWHVTMPVRSAVPKRGTLTLKVSRHKTPKAGTPVFLIDRREKELQKILAEWTAEISKIAAPTPTDVIGAPWLPKSCKPARWPDMEVFRSAARSPKTGKGGRAMQPAFWLDAACLDLPKNLMSRIAFWLPPDIWPDDQGQIADVINGLRRAGANSFVCNAPWQRIFFPDKLSEGLSLIAGPFCNTANALAIQGLARLGFRAAFACQELASKELLSLPGQSCLPLGLVLKGFFPVGISRFGLAGFKSGEGFASPKGEIFWTKQYGEATWIYPGWELDLSAKRRELEKAGYSFFAIFRERLPKNIEPGKRQGLFNWNGQLL